jgi:hypothetical protein
MNSVGVVLLGLAGLLGVSLFLLSTTEHRHTMKQQQLEHAIQVERFDRDFERAWNGQKLVDPERDKRLADLEQRQRDAHTQATHEDAAREAREHQLRHTLDQLSVYQSKQEAQKGHTP